MYYILGDTDIVVVRDNSQLSKTFLPTKVHQSHPEEIWDWMQQREVAEKELKSAIADNKVISIVSDTILIINTVKLSFCSQKNDLTPYFDEYAKFLTIDKADVLQKNEDFFESLSHGNLKVMEALWHQSNESIYLQV